MGLADYPQPSVAVDCVVFGLDLDNNIGTCLKVLLIERGVEPFAGSWALPGGFVGIDENLDTAARRELAEEAGLSQVFLEQLYTFGKPTRDPRGRVVSVAYYALVRLSDHLVQAATDARQARWFQLTQCPKLAFDHQTIIEMAYRRLQGKVRYQPLGFELLPQKFTLSQLQRMYERILERPLDKRNFRKKILGMDLLVALDETEQGVAHRAARLYAFDAQRYKRLVQRGFNFEV